MAASGSKTIVLFALGANFGIAIAKFTAAAWTSSSAMFSEGVHSLVDTANQALILFGLKRATRPADAKHPFGYSKELYFWCFVVAVILFALGAGVSIYEGIEKTLHPHPMSDPTINYIVLGIALLLEGTASYKAIKEFNRRYPNQPPFSALKRSKDPALFAVVLEDIAACAGLIIAAIGIFCADFFGWLQADGIASIIIGIILAITAITMSIEIKALLIGEAASQEVQAGLKELIDAEMGPKGSIKAINEIRTMHLGPEDILMAASVDFKDNQSSQAVEAVTARLETAIKEKYPEVRRLFLEVQSVEAHKAVLIAEAEKHGLSLSTDVMVSEEAEAAISQSVAKNVAAQASAASISPAVSGAPAVSAEAPPTGSVPTKLAGAGAPAATNLAARPKSRKDRKRSRKRKPS